MVGMFLTQLKLRDKIIKQWVRSVRVRVTYTHIHTQIHTHTHTHAVSNLLESISFDSLIEAKVVIRSFSFN